MSVRLRLKRLGSTHRPYYRLVSVDQRRKRDGAVIEELGTYNPLVADDKQLDVKTERCEYWLSVGAQPSETVAALLKRAGLDVVVRERPQAKRAAEARAAAEVQAAADAKAAAEAKAAEAEAATATATEEAPTDAAPADEVTEQAPADASAAEQAAEPADDTTKPASGAE